MKLPIIRSRRSRAANRAQWLRTERVTVGLAVISVGGSVAVIAGQYGRMLRHRVADDPDDPRGHVVESAAIDTAQVAVEGYSAAPRHELVLFHLLLGFLGAFSVARLSTWGIREQRGPFRNISVGGRHLHHFVPGILIAFGSGITALLTDSNKLEERLAIPMGAGMGLTFDEAALLLDLQDVYWSRQGMLSVQLSLGLSAILSMTILTLRMLRRGERRLGDAGTIPLPSP